MVAVGLALAAGIGIFQLTDRAVSAGWAVLAAVIGLVVAAWGVRPRASWKDSGSTKGGSAMDENLERQEWEPAGSTGHFYKISMPMSGEARGLGGSFRRLLYAEFDTADEAAAWKEFVYDPLKVLIAEKIVSASPVGDPHVHVTIYKLTGEPATDEGYLAAVRDRGQRAAELYARAVIEASTRRAWHVGTTVVNHEQPLNPRIGMASILL
jgi:hypothetical protein